ncbi:DNA polymerase III, chi subunit [Magnetococcus marinus MC-1]|uniref:DNA polymerase III, chi subunit n=1 Tax=Magnetococcus marinus (strain ATCC BAA-1437 / JCM 17883 / MC-1) TaxID=156889 RepID=A0LB28_MAGMM|nr:DNA polymerase III subunit chi [Magnetococcus marinus]ABK45171.1 DNA polymerase III, chi subunit [Magnetococcus marinus MC-1]
MAKTQQDPLRVRFYQLATDSRERALLKILNKVYGMGLRVCIVVEDRQQAQGLDEHLWRHPPDSFLPHATSVDPFPEAQPILISEQPVDPNGATVVVMLTPVPLENLDQFDTVVDFVPDDPQAKRASRLRYKHYKDAQCQMEYWIQTPKGQWERAAAS